MVTFSIHAWRFSYEARDQVFFPPASAGNILRGAFGAALRRICCDRACPGPESCEVRNSCVYARFFEPVAIEARGPSGLADLPRPFVFRTRLVDGREFRKGEIFTIDVHVFHANNPEIRAFVEALLQVGRQGMGSARARAQLVRVEQIGADRRTGAILFLDHAFTGESQPLQLSLLPGIAEVSGITVNFLTPTELKAGGTTATAPEFPVLLGRARDRVSTLSALYGPGPLSIDFARMGERAQQVRMTRCEIENVEVQRRSSRTGQTHGIGGFAGVAEYEGNLTEFLPVLRAAEWTGVGRQTVWGKGEIRVTSQ